MYESRRSSKLVSRTSYEDEKEEEEEEEESEEINFRWRNLIFLPFHPFFKGIVIYIVIIKTILVSFVNPKSFSFQFMNYH